MLIKSLLYIFSSLELRSPKFLFPYCRLLLSNRFEDIAPFFIILTPLYDISVIISDLSNFKSAFLINMVLSFKEPKIRSLTLLIFFNEYICKLNPNKIDATYILLNHVVSPYSKLVCVKYDDFLPSSTVVPRVICIPSPFTSGPINSKLAILYLLIFSE
nr:MAG TPA: hypothetical protein [Crassvirales sp.]